MMDKKYLEEVKARCEAATPGPWIVRENKSFGVQSENKNIASCFRRENENFIAHARTDIPALLTEVERLTEENEKMKPFYKIADDTFKHWENAAYAMRDEERARNAAKGQQIDELTEKLKKTAALGTKWADEILLKDEKIATLEKALELACKDHADGCTWHPDSVTVESLMEYYVR